MAYLSLKKALHSARTSERFEHVQTLHRARLESESTFRTGITVGQDELFLAVPRELSLLSERVLCHERKIEDQLQSLPPIAQDVLIRGLVVDEVVSTNELEGVYCTKHQIGELLKEIRAGSNLLDDKRFRGLTKLYLDLYDGTSKQPTTGADIRSIYDELMAGEPLDERHKPDGRYFRRGGVEIIASNGKVVHEGIVPESRIIEMVESMLAIANSDEMPELYRAIVAHFIFEYTHPFYDGNGWTGRYLLALQLSGSLSIATSLSLSRMLAENREAYFRSFRQVEHPLNHGELTSFVINILKITNEGQGRFDVELVRKMERYQNAVERFEAFQGMHDLSDREMDIVTFLIIMRLFAAFPDSTLDELADHMILSTQQVWTYTKRLESMGLIAATRKNPLTFVLSEETIGALGISKA